MVLFYSGRTFSKIGIEIARRSFYRRNNIDSRAKGTRLVLSENMVYIERRFFIFYKRFEKMERTTICVMNTDVPPEGSRNKLARFV